MSDVKGGDRTFPDNIGGIKTSMGILNAPKTDG